MLCLVGCLQCRRCILQTPIDSKRSTHHRDAPQHSMLATAWINYKNTASYFQLSLSSNGIRYLKPNFVGIARNKQTTGLGHVTKRDLQSIEVSLPPLPEQRAIAHVLGTLDDKIELNRRMNETLEEMARALFKSWFVDFDPVRAKMEGRWRRGESLPGLPADLYDLFPDRLVASELGEIPEGWEVKALGELVELAYGKALKAADRRDGPIPVYGSNGQIGWHDKRLVSGPGIVVGRKGNPGVVTWTAWRLLPNRHDILRCPKRRDNWLALPVFRFDLTRPSVRFSRFRGAGSESKLGVHEPATCT